MTQYNIWQRMTSNSMQWKMRYPWYKPTQRKLNYLRKVAADLRKRGTTAYVIRYNQEAKEEGK